MADGASGIRRCVLVGSGKGGVGKSTVALNVAVGLRDRGAKVGVLDADIYGPSFPLMLGIEGVTPDSRDGEVLLPVEAHGLRCMSIGLLTGAGQAMIWRGPMLAKAIVQLIENVDWGELDYLVVDLPPGTGDAPLTVARHLPRAAAVLVTTPQDVALADVRRAKTMFDKVNVPILGVVENMSFFVCPHCRGETDVFARGGGERVAGELELAFLGGVPLNASIREAGDEGVPHLIADPDGDEGRALAEIAGRVEAAMQAAALDDAEPGKISLRVVT